MTLIEASKKINSAKVYKNLYPIEPEFNQLKPKFKFGNKVRISKYKNVFQKGYIGNSTEEIFTICQIIYSNLPTYKIKDYKDEEIQGLFYEQELTKYNKIDNEYEIESIIKTKKSSNGKTLHLVKWKGYPHTFNSWVDAINS